MKTAIYCRVSTDAQEREGSSLETQSEYCLKKAIDLHFSDPLILKETYSGLTIDRPKLQELREMVRKNEVDAVIAYTLDRLSRDPVHFIILQEEMERNGVELILVTETVDSTDIGRLVMHVRGLAAKMEAEKIKDRTQRGLRKRAENGRIPSGHRGRLYGYNYMPGKGPGEGIRYVNEDQARWIRQIFEWYVSEGMGIERLCFKLKEHNVTSPAGKPYWNAATIAKTLKNRAYIGETYVYTKYLVKGHVKRYLARPREQWISIPGATPAIISQEIFEAAQEKLKHNKDHAKRNSKTEYLLAGHVVCGKCNRPYWGMLKRVVWNKKTYPHRYYHCAGKFKRVSYETCDNHNWSADKLESEVWAEIEKVLAHPEVVLKELESQQVQQAYLANMDKELTTIEKRLISLDKEQETLLQWALKGFPELTVIKENERINNLRTQLTKDKLDLESRITRIRQNTVDTGKVKEVCQLLKESSKELTFKSKSLVLEVLRIRIVINGDKFTIHGAVPPEYGSIVSTLPAWSNSNKPMMTFTI